MKTSSLKLQLICLLTFFVGISYAQDTLSRFNQNLDLFKNGKTFFDVKKEYEEFYKSRDKGKGSGYKQFIRWADQMKYIVNPDGTMPNPGTIKSGFQEAEAMKRQQGTLDNNTSRLSSGATWTEIGSKNWKHGTKPWELGAGRFVEVAVSQNEQIIYAGGQGSGIWKSIDGGANWTNILASYNGINTVSSIDIDATGTNIYAAFSDPLIGNAGGVTIIKSTNGGITWTETGFSSFVSNSTIPFVFKVMFSRTNPNRVYAATGGGLYISTNGGGTVFSDWTLILTTGNTIWDVEQKPGSDKIYCSAYVLPSSADAKIYFSDDGLTNFTLFSMSGFSKPLGSTWIAVTPAEPNSLFIADKIQTGFQFHNIFKSNDNGSTYNLIADYVIQYQYSTWGDFVVSDTDADIMFLGGDFAEAVNVIINGNSPSWLQATNNNFTTDKPDNPSLYIHVDVRALTIVNGHIYVATDGTLSKSTSTKQDFIDYTQTWTDLTKDMNVKMYYKIGTSKTDLNFYGGATQDNDINIHDTLSVGYDWRGRIFTNSDYGDGTELLIGKNNNRVYMSIQNAGFKKSDNRGLTFSNMNQNNPSSGAGQAPLEKHPHNDDILYSAFYDGGYPNSSIYKTNDGMQSWKKLINSPPLTDISSIKICETRTNYLYAIGNVSSVGNNFFVSADSGNTWVNRSAGLPQPYGYFISSVSYDPANPEYIMLTYGGYSNGIKVYISNDLGLSWTNASFNLPNIPVYSSVIQHNLTNPILYVGTYNGVYYKEKNSTVWQMWGTNLPSTPVRDMEITYNNSKLRIGTFGRGMWESDVKTTMSENIESGMDGLAVTNLTSYFDNALNTTRYRIGLSWLDYHHNETDIQILRSTNGTNWTILTTLPPNTTDFTTTEYDLVNVCSNIYYKIVCMSGINLIYSNTVVINRDEVFCKAPTNLTVTAPNTTQFQLNWTDNSTTETGFKVNIYKSGSLDKEVIIPAFTGTGNRTYTITNQPANGSFDYIPNIQYCFEIKSTYAAGLSSLPTQQTCSILLPPPTSINFNVVSSTSISGSWVSQTGVSGNRINLSKQGNFFSEIDLVGNTTIVNNLIPKTTFTYYLYSYENGYGGTFNYFQSQHSNNFQITTSDEIPTNLTATTSNGVFPITLNWNYLITDGVSGEGFQIERSIDGGTSYTLLGTVNNISVRTFSDNTNINGVLTYHYRIRAIHDAGSNNFSAWSNIAIVTNTLPVAPSGLIASQGLGKVVNLTWTGNNTNASYEIDRSDNNGVSFNLIGNSGINTNFTDNTVPSYGVAYQYKVRAVNSNGNSGNSNTVTITLQDNVSPAAPTSLVATSPLNSGLKINLTWTDNSNDETGFVIERTDLSTGLFSILTTTTANVTTFSDLTVLQKEEYSYRVKAVKNSLSSDYSNTSTTNAPSFRTPVNFFLLVMSNTAIQLQWQNIATAATGIEIWRSTSLNGTYSLITTVSPSTTSYLNTGLNANTTYFYKIRAVINSPALQTAYTTTVNAKTYTLFTSPPAITSLTKLSSTSIRLNWTDNSIGENGFEIYRSTDNANFTLVTTTASNVITFTNTGLSSGVTYYYRMRGIKRTGSVVTSVTNLSNTASLLLTAKIAADYTGPKEIENIEETVNVHPNPVKNTMILEYNCFNRATVLLTIYDLLGNIKIQKKINVLKGLNRIDLPVYSLIAGHYKLVMNNNDRIVETKFIKD